MMTNRILVAIAASARSGMRMRRMKSTSFLQLLQFGTRARCQGAAGIIDDQPLEPFAFVPAMVSLHVFASVMDTDSDRRASHRTLPVGFEGGPR